MSVIRRANHPEWEESLERAVREDLREDIDSKVADFNHARTMAFGPNRINAAELQNMAEAARSITEIIEEHLK